MPEHRRALLREPNARRQHAELAVCELLGIMCEKKAKHEKLADTRSKVDRRTARMESWVSLCLVLLLFVRRRRIQSTLFFLAVHLLSLSACALP